MDAVEVALVIIGWIVAGLVTLWGVRLTERYGEKREARREFLDLRTSVLGPIHAELESFLAWEKRGHEGYLVWSVPGQEFQNIRSMGKLFNPQLASVRADLDRLLHAHEEYAAAYWNLSKQIEKATSETFKNIFVGVGQGPWNKDLLDYMMNPRLGSIDGLFSALFVGDQAAFTSPVLDVIAKLLSQGANAQGFDVKQLYKDARSSLEPNKRTHDQKLEAFLALAKKVQASIRRRLESPE